MSANPFLSVSHRLRNTPFTHRVTKAGVKAYTVYNHMLLPTVFESLESDYHHLKEHVQVWDVSCERQVEISGNDASRLVQLLTPRNLASMQDDQCFYVPMVDRTGGMLNDPVLLKVDDDRYWLSIADSDVLYWVSGIATGMNLDVTVTEPDVSPLAVQGPKSEELMSLVFGDAVREIRFFRYRKLVFLNNTFVVARSGYSKQGGFEIYVEGSGNGEPLWDALFEAGRTLDVRAGCPNLIERLESGLLSYGNDMTRDNNPHECGLGKFCNAPEDIDYIGKQALDAITSDNLQRQIRGVRIDGAPLHSCSDAWPASQRGRSAGQVSSAIWSPGLNCNIGIAMIERDCWDVGTRITVDVRQADGNSDTREATVCELPFV